MIIDIIQGQQKYLYLFSHSANLAEQYEAQSHLFLLNFLTFARDNCMRMKLARHQSTKQQKWWQCGNSEVSFHPGSLFSENFTNRPAPSSKMPDKPRSPSQLYLCSFLGFTSKKSFPSSLDSTFTIISGTSNLSILLGQIWYIYLSFLLYMTSPTTDSDKGIRAIITLLFKKKKEKKRKKAPFAIFFQKFSVTRNRITLICTHQVS